MHPDGEAMLPISHTCCGASAPAGQNTSTAPHGCVVPAVDSTGQKYPAGHGSPNAVVTPAAQ
jgi:hypothetical protein